MALAVAVAALVFAAKLAVYFLSGLIALLAEALHTLSDIIIYGFLFLAAIRSRRPADPEHMFGHGRAQHVAALVAATLLISFTSLRLLEEAVPRLFHAKEATYQNLGLATGVIVASMLAAAAPLVALAMQKPRGPAARAQLTAVVGDELGLLAALLGTLFILWGYPLADPLAAVVVAIVIASSAIGLLRENSSLLLGRSPGPAYLARVEQRARAVPGVLGVHGVRAEYIGSGVVHVTMHVEAPADDTLQEAHRLAVEVDRAVHQEFPSGFCVIHVDPARRSGASPLVGGGSDRPVGETGNA